MTAQFCHPELAEGSRERDRGVVWSSLGYVVAPTSRVGCLRACRGISERDSGVVSSYRTREMTKKSLVYSTDQGRHCPKCSQPVNDCQCKTSAATPDGDGIVRIRRESKGRNGKPVTLVTGLLKQPSELKELAKQLKQALWCRRFH